MASRGQSSRRVLTTNSAIRAMALMAVDYSPELSPLASPPSCLRQLGGVSAAAHRAERGSPRTATGRLGTARLAALVPAALLDHVTAAAHRAERGSPRTATGRLGSHDFRSFHRSPRRPRACGNSGASRLARHYFASWKITPSV